MAQKTEPHDGAQGSGQRDDNTPTDNPAITKLQRTKYRRKVQSTALYRALVAELENRRGTLGLSLAQVDDLSGLNDGHYSHLITPDTPNGRQARWETLQLAVDALYKSGFSIALVP